MVRCGIRNPFNAQRADHAFQTDLRPIHGHRILNALNRSVLLSVYQDRERTSRSSGCYQRRSAFVFTFKYFREKKIEQALRPCSIKHGQQTDRTIAQQP